MNIVTLKKQSTARTLFLGLWLMGVNTVSAAFEPPVFEETGEVTMVAGVTLSNDSPALQSLKALFAQETVGKVLELLSTKGAQF